MSKVTFFLPAAFAAVLYVEGTMGGGRSGGRKPILRARNAAYTRYRAIRSATSQLGSENSPVDVGLGREVLLEDGEAAVGGEVRERHFGVCERVGEGGEAEEKLWRGRKMKCPLTRARGPPGRRERSVGRRRSAKSARGQSGGPERQAASSGLVEVTGRVAAVIQTHSG